jgi:hypothetical protein
MLFIIILTHFLIEESLPEHVKEAAKQRKGSTSFDPDLP